jgi:phosphatidylethanolamine/phosphatidyl-N-methylethanolamine N-methyltransferase
MSRPKAAEQAQIDSRRVERVYSTLARFYDAGFDWALGPGRRRAIARLPIGPGDKVLEVGVGTGLSIPHYPKDCRLVGIDISEPMLELARERAEALGHRRVDLRRMDARDLAFPDGAFDCVLAPYVISVVPEPERVMREIARVCRPGGTVVVVNHFGSPRAPVRAVEAWLSGASQWLGFRLDLPVDTVTRTPGLRCRGTERVNLFGCWLLVELARDP